MDSIIFEQVNKLGYFKMFWLIDDLIRIITLFKLLKVVPLECANIFTESFTHQLLD